MPRETVATSYQLVCRNMAFLRVVAVLWWLCFLQASFARTVQDKKRRDVAVKWIVSIERNSKKVCEGVQVSKEWILTLGDCIKPKKMKKYKIVMFNGEVRDVLNEMRSSVEKMLVLLKINIKDDVEQDYPGLARAVPKTKFEDNLKMYSRDASGNFAATSIAIVPDSKCLEQEDFGRYRRKKHDCFTANPVSSTECLIKTGNPIFGNVKNKWVLFGFSTRKGDVCDDNYKQSTRVAPHRQWVKKMLKECGPLPPIVKGFSELDNAFSSSIGSTASVTCDKGHTSDNPVVVCQNNGNWQEATCVVNDCGNPKGDESLSIDYSTTIFESEATVSCNDGYENPIPARITCQASGKWEEATCEIKDCGSPEGDRSVRFDYSTTTFESEATVTCNDGYENPVPARITCQASGKWEEATCTIKDCGSPKGDGSVRFDYTATTFESEASVSCNAGYKNPIPAKITCQASGKWEEANCKIKDCGSPKGDGSVRFDYTATTFESEASVSCNAGYKNPIPAKITCQASGKWEEANCKIKDCGSPKGDGSVRFDYTATTFESEATVSCSAGYKNPIPAKITCQASGKWEEATCKIKDCGSPKGDGSVRFDYATTTFESEASVSCKDGYKNPIPARITCRASGKWEEATCKIKDCGPPEGDGSVRFDYTTTTFDSEASISCKAGYENPIPAKITCQASGKWEEATCKIKDCGPPEGDGSVRFNFSTTTFESEATVTCNDGYENPTPTRITCQASGKWEEAKCTIKDCGSPEGNGFVRFDYTTTTFESEANVTCNDGYENPIPARVTCQASGKWEEATCTIKDCGSPEVDGSVRFDYTTTTFESEATVSCNDGYENPIPARITCRASGKWEEATCKIKDCGSPKGDGSVRFDYTATTFESEATVSCNAGYKNPIPAKITCQASGKWEEATCKIKDCGSPKGDGSVRFDYATTTFESEASVSCKDGYKNPIPARITCRASGKWEEATCKIKDCGPPEGDGSVRFDYTTTTFDSEASISCKAGYENPIPAKITCQASGKWEEATCKIKDCGPPEGDGSVRFNFSTTTFESEATVTCNDGYENPTPPRITCQASGKWEEAKCTIKDCGSPEGNGFVRFDYTTTTFESEANVTCNDGYENPIPARVTCQASGKWEEATCTIKDCGSPEGDGSVRFDYTTTTFESEANVTCNDGYKNPIPARITCQASGKWEEATCTIIDCGSPKGDGSVRFDYTATTFESEASVSCNDGYENPIPAKITCQASGKWEEAICKIKDCGSPKGDGSVRFDYTATTFESEATVTCNDGYENPIPAKITCQASGKWEEAICKIKDCGSPKGDGSVRFDYTTTTFESEATVTCNDGYENPIPAKITCQASGKWEEATCTIIDCGSPKGDGSVRFDYTATTFESEATVSCNDGYENPIPAKITCQASGKWEEATCKIKDCGSPEGDGSVRFDYTTTTFESEATVSCNDGYENPIPAKITCQASGKWEEATCTIIDCGSPKSDGSVRFDYTATIFESEATVSCNDGYENPIPARITCQASGKWEEATCTRIDCGSPKSDGSVRFDYTATIFESEATVSCNDGYENPIPARITCQASGKWEEATCTIIDCGSPKGDGSVRFDYTATTIESEATVSCNDGYENPIPAKITCQASGKWEEATCKIKDCGSPEGDGSVRFDYTTTTFESEATVTCNDGFINPSTERIRCQASGEWEKATCLKDLCAPSLPTISNGGVTRDSNTAATVKCDAGYRPSTFSEAISCEESSGSWTPHVTCDLICNNPNEVTVDGTRYRLCDGDGSGSNGRLEVYVEGEWGTVCSDYWQRENYNFEVTCRMFGYRDGKEASFTQGWGSILMDNVYCRTDSVNSLIDCFRGYVYWTFNVMYTFTPFGEYTTSTTTYLTYYFSSYYELGEHNCNHRKDVGISCYS